MTDRPNAYTILYIEEKKKLREEYSALFQPFVQHVYQAGDGIEGLELYQKHHPNIVICDLNLPKISGIELAKSIRAINQHQHIIFTIPHFKSDEMQKALQFQAAGYLIKPLEKQSVHQLLSHLMQILHYANKASLYQKILYQMLNEGKTIKLLTDFRSITMASNSFYALFGLSSKETFFKRYQTFFDIFTTYKDNVYGNDKQSFLFAYENLPSEKRIISLATTEGVKSFYIHILPMGAGEDPLYLLSLTNIKTQEKQKLLAQYKATHDPLTGVLNRSKFQEIFELEYQRAYRYKRPLCLALIDIDKFKTYNETHGELIGDEALKQLSSYIEDFIRKTDVLARWGGEKFIVILSETSLDATTKLCETLRQNIAHSILKNLPPFTISIGVTTLKEEDSIELLCQRLHEALEAAKFNGHDQCIAL